MSEPRIVKVAAIQVSSENGQVERNLQNAARFVHTAAQQGAQLVLAPEFLAAGYLYEESIWKSAETQGGPTEHWLSRQAQTQGVYVGASFLEAEGEDFYNTFSLFDPGGALVGRVRKASLPFFEGWFFRASKGPKVIESELGKLGVGICNDNMTAEFLVEMFAEQPDLILMPHSAPTPSLPFGGKLLARVFTESLRQIASQYATQLGIPVVMANKVSTEIGKTSVPLVPKWQLQWAFHGYSSVTGADGAQTLSKEDQEAALVAQVSLDPERKSGDRPQTDGYWSFPPSMFASAAGLVLRLFEAVGQYFYSENPRRRAAARRVLEKHFEAKAEDETSGTI